MTLVEIVEITPIPTTPWSYYIVRGGALLVCVYGWHVLCVASAVSAASIALTISTPTMGLVYQPGATDLHKPLRLYNPSFPRRERADLVPSGEQIRISNGQVVHPELDGVMRNHISYLKEWERGLDICKVDSEGWLLMLDVLDLYTRIHIKCRAYPYLLKNEGIISLVDKIDAQIFPFLELQQGVWGNLGHLTHESIDSAWVLRDTLQYLSYFVSTCPYGSDYWLVWYL